ncbi:Rieske (2Fe-2S) protein [Actinomycetospora endophytica]|uniref:Rieske (2Fe-2S) protein n=1 Tax=Actinomycetospora endophytica TaxID=2291215 RepID=A0ABS8P408_9PSEU|nr:Rieske (2Fe-2S) protein [Actinomycetospora endophytica]MCD2192990.1 Rieske (2Fe-2S) protein [Actinomycetospora endophytica]
MSGRETVSTRLGPVEQIPLGEGRAFLVGDEPVAVFRPRSGGLSALRAVCPHRGGPLADGLVDAELVMCPLHNHQFRLRSGECVSGGGVSGVAAYTASDDDGELVVSLVTPDG